MVNKWVIPNRLSELQGMFMLRLVKKDDVISEQCWANIHAMIISRRWDMT